MCEIFEPALLGPNLPADGVAGVVMRLSCARQRDDGERIRIEAQERGLLRYVITLGWP